MEIIPGKLAPGSASATESSGNGDTEGIGLGTDSIKFSLPAKRTSKQILSLNY